MLDYNAIFNECTFKAVRSSGSGGQHVNKVSTKIEVYFNIEQSEVLSEEQKEKISSKLTNRLTKSLELIVTSQDTRSQFKNKQRAFKKLIDLLNKSLLTAKTRKETAIPRSVKIKRLKQKKVRSHTKKNRQKPDLDT
jgi:ribosome-associated protein